MERRTKPNVSTILNALHLFVENKLYYILHIRLALHLSLLFRIFLWFFFRTTSDNLTSLTLFLWMLTGAITAFICLLEMKPTF